MANDDYGTLEILGQKIKPGQSAVIDFSVARLFTSTKVEIPVFVERSKIPGPTILITAGIHGDEINGIDVVRQAVEQKIHMPKKGTIITVPILNVFGFLNSERYFPDGRDLNRSFPGTKSGSLASRVAYHFTQEILPLADFCLDFHTGGAARFNSPQVRLTKGNEELLVMAKIFNAPFTFFSAKVEKTYRHACSKKNIPILLYEGGKSLDINADISEYGVNGIKNILNHLDMLNPDVQISKVKKETTIIHASKWLRAGKSGLFHPEIECSTYVEKGELLAYITDPFGRMKHRFKSPADGHIINVNHSPIVHQGDALFHITTRTE